LAIGQCNNGKTNSVFELKQRKWLKKDWWTTTTNYIRKPPACRHGQVDKKCSLSHKKLQVDNFFYDLKVKILLHIMINMKINFHFNIINLKGELFHVDLSRFYQIAFTYIKCPI
jgi:hypothetical protein